MTIDRKAARLWLDRFSEVLNREWDPIGVVHDGINDEYDSYASRLAGMIHRGATDEQLMAFLEWAECDDIGLGRPFGRERAERVIKALRALGQP